MIELTNRELASIILAGLAVLLAFVIPKFRHHLAQELENILKHLFVWQVQIPLYLYFLYAAILVYLGWDIGVWDLSLIKDTVIIIIFVGVPMLFSAAAYGRGTALFKDTLRDTLGAAALIGFYINLESLPLTAELVAQPTILLLSLLAASAAHKKEHRLVKAIMETLLGLIGLALLVYVTIHVKNSWSLHYGEDVLSSLGLSIVLPLLLLPFIHVFAFVARSETLIRVLPNFSSRKLPLNLYIAFIWGLHLRIKLANDFHGLWLQSIAEAQTIEDVHGVMRSFRKAVRLRNSKLREYRRTIRTKTGIKGSDKQGTQLDRREYHETKEILNNLQSQQLALYRNYGKTYKDNPILIISPVSSKEPVLDLYNVTVRKDGKAWMAWRQTPNGWHLGIGGTARIEEKWVYTGPRPPTTFPSLKVEGWHNTAKEPSPPDWKKNDEPPRYVGGPESSN